MHITSRLQLFPRPIPEIHSVAPVSHSSSSMQVLLTLTYTEHHCTYYQPQPAHAEEAASFFRLPVTILSTLRLSSFLPVACFSGYSSAYRVLSPILRELRFVDPQERRALVEKIASQVSKIVGWVSRNRKVLPLEMEIVRERKIVITYQDLIERAIRESRMESERNYGMIPTAKGSCHVPGRISKPWHFKNQQESEE